MKKLLSYTSALILLVLAISNAIEPVYAADCAGKAQQIAAQKKGQLLAVTDLGNGKCEATIRIPGKNGKAPRVVNRSFKG